MHESALCNFNIVPVIVLSLSMDVLIKLFVKYSRLSLIEIEGEGFSS